MALVFSAVTPHPPISIPEIGKDNINQIKSTIEAFKKLNRQLIDLQPEIILTISPHGLICEKAFNLSLAQKYFVNFQEFGDFVTQLEFDGNFEFIHQIKNSLVDSSKDLPLILNYQSQLDYGTSIPLYYLTLKIKNFSILPINISLLNHAMHFKFGQAMGRQINLSTLKIAVIASGELAHTLTQDSPAGYNEKGQIFDDKLIKYLKKKEVDKIINLDTTLVEEANQCGLKPFLILLGILDGINYQPEVLSYEGPLGVGYLMMNFKLE
ncbi:MAG: class III extradiol dioxygenase subunit B-like domain-containing protein [Patescibacteria group bacterium]|jgi:aromatic ring-opening dioxygenase LigB subunit|nr:class III extradiol dioxygenase subunit B-like domain-containing protein [Patescibacteria group bacterium]